MQLTVEGKQLDIGDALRQYVEDQLIDAAKKYFANPIEATVVLAKETSLLFSADISIHVGKNILLQAHHEANDPYAAFDVAVSRLTKRMRRYKDKLRSYHKRAAQEEGQGVLAKSYTLSGSDDEDIGPESGDEPVIVGGAIAGKTTSGAFGHRAVAFARPRRHRPPRGGRCRCAGRRRSR